MGWGVLADPKMDAPPGTATIGGDTTVGKERIIRTMLLLVMLWTITLTRCSHLESPDMDDKTLKRDGNIILQPQPSDNPNDPLNW